MDSIKIILAKLTPLNIFVTAVVIACIVLLVLYFTGNLTGKSEAFTMSPEEEGQPVMEQPVMEQPVMEQPMMEQPMMEQPMMEQPMTPPTDEEEQKRKMNEYLTQLAEYEQKYKAELEKNAALREEGYIY